MNSQLDTPFTYLYADCIIRYIRNEKGTPALQLVPPIEERFLTFMLLVTDFYFLRSVPIPFVLKN